MKNRLLSFMGAGLLSLGMIGVAFAGHAYGHYKHGPELDPGSIGSGLALLGGSGLILLERFRHRNPK